MPLKTNITKEESAAMVEDMYAPQIPPGRYLAIITNAEEYIGKDAKTVNLRTKGKEGYGKSYSWKMTFMINAEKDAVDPERGWLPDDQRVFMPNTWVWVTHVSPDAEEGKDFEMLDDAKVGTTWLEITNALDIDWTSEEVTEERLIGRQLVLRVLHGRDDYNSDQTGMEIKELVLPPFGGAATPYVQFDEQGPALPGWKQGSAPNKKPF